MLLGAHPILHISRIRVNYLHVFRLQRNKYSEQSAGWKLRGSNLGREQVFIIFSKGSKTDCMATQLRMQCLLPFFPGDKSQGHKFYRSYFSSLAGDVIVLYAFTVRTVTVLYLTPYYLQLRYLSATAWSPVALDATSYPRIMECSASWYCYRRITSIHPCICQ